MGDVSKNLAVLIFLVYYSSQVETQDQGVYLQLLNGTRVSNHGFVGRGELSIPTDNPLLCVTPDNITCCSTEETRGAPLGNWYLPNGTEVPPDSTGWNFSTTWGPGVVRLHRRTGGVSGIYHCVIPDQSGVNQAIYVGLYSISSITSGQILLQQNIEFQLLSLEPITDPPTFTLTCVTTGGPPTSVTWTRDNIEIDYESDHNFKFSQTVANFVSSTYNNTLTVTGRYPGQYNMTAWNRNTVQYIDSQFAISAISVTAAAPPTHLTAVQGSDPTTVNVSWTAPVSGDSVTGYRIYYQTEGDQGNVDVGASATQHALTDLCGGRNYSIYLVALSAHLPSPVVGPAVVRLGGITDETLCPSVTTRSSTTSLDATADTNNTTDTMFSTTSTPDSTGVPIGAVVAGAVGAAVLLGLLVLVTCICFIFLRRGDSKQKASPSSLQELEVISSDQATEAVSTNSAAVKPITDTLKEIKEKTGNKETINTENQTDFQIKHEQKTRDIAVVIEEFPQDTMHVTEGESALLHVKVTGAPKPTLVWYFEGKELQPDYSIDVAEEDGSLSTPSAETRHAGVYKLVATNTAGSVEKEVKLFVHKEGDHKPGLVDQKVLKPVPVAEFGKYVEELHGDGNKQFRKQYRCLPKEGDGCSVAVGTKPENMPRNKFKNIIVYDDSRVILRPLPGRDDCQHDYINASYVDGYSLPCKFIATQAPISNTVIDFWRLVWQEKCPSIVMLTNLVEGGKVKCLQYWPDSDSKNYGPFEVTVTDKQMFADYSIRVFQIELSGSTDPPLKVTQFHFTAWPDHGVPDYATPILAFHRRVKSQHDSAKGPLLVHCSAGVGRTGTLITIDGVLENVKKDGMVDIAGTVNKIRQQRMNMVQTVEQYIFIHDAILESVTCGDTQIVASDLQDALEKLQMGAQSGPTGLESQFQVLDQVTLKPGDVCRDCAVQFGEKNRNMDYLPADHWRVILKGEYPDYINAVFVNGYKQQKAFIIAQGPMESTCRDFWKMVHDRRCGGIVMLSRLREEGKEVCYQYWPSSGDQQYGEYSVDLLGEEELEGHIIRTLNITHSTSGKAHQVTQFHIMNWNPDGRCSNLKTITGVIEEVTKVQRRTSTHPIVVHCSDTVSRSGMFCAIATTIERCKTEGVVDIFQVVKALRVQKPGAILNVEQYQMVFEAVLAYLGSFDTYANFQNI